MDIVAHFLLVYLLFLKHPDKILLSLIGICPDLLSLSSYYLRLFLKKIKKKKIKIYLLEKYIYRLTHSLLIFTLVFIMFYLINKSLLIYLIPWLIHILVDIPTHSKNYHNLLEDFSTKILWPFSDISFDGFDWVKGYALFKLYVLLIISYFLFMF
ncbi:hypothetical protein KY321_03115 [Candidatus Woesearchaeota archaeon]|nr:hypothetical protein [Candidatus Woesearchaeota archaeon]